MASSFFMSLIDKTVQEELFRRTYEPRGSLDSNSVRSLWIKMTSGVIDKENSDDRGNQPVLMGGTLNDDGTLRDQITKHENLIKKLKNS